MPTSKYKKISAEAAVTMAALLALHDLETGNTKQAIITLNYLVDRLRINDIKDLLEKRLSNINRRE